MNNSEDLSACAEYEPLLQRLLFDELAESERPFVERHLEGCAGCRAALADARQGLFALDVVDEPPLPFPDGMVPDEPSAEAAWAEFQHRVDRKAWHREASDREITSTANPWWLPYRGLAAAAALLLVGFGVGHWVAMQRDGAAPNPVLIGTTGMEVLRVETDAVEALARAELLSDVGLRYVRSLQDLLKGVMTLSAGGVERGDLVNIRNEARELIRDGRLLRRSLDPEKDELFLSAIDRAELFLEEVAAVENDAPGTGVGVIQAALRTSGLNDQIAAIDVDEEVDRALQNAGWIGEEFAPRKEF